MACDREPTSWLSQGHTMLIWLNTCLRAVGLARTWQERQDSRLTNKVITLWYR